MAIIAWYWLWLDSCSTILPRRVKYQILPAVEGMNQAPTCQPVGPRTREESQQQIRNQGDCIEADEGDEDQRKALSRGRTDMSQRKRMF